MKDTVSRNSSLYFKGAPIQVQWFALGEDSNLIPQHQEILELSWENIHEKFPKSHPSAHRGCHERWYQPDKADSHMRGRRKISGVWLFIEYWCLGCSSWTCYEFKTKVGMMKSSFYWDHFKTIIYSLFPHFPLCLPPHLQILYSSLFSPLHFSFFSFPHFSFNKCSFIICMGEWRTIHCVAYFELKVWSLFFSHRSHPSTHWDEQ